MVRRDRKKKIEELKKALEELEKNLNLAVPYESLEKLKKLRAPRGAMATGLLRLPFEIRLQIYQYCIPQKRVIEVSSPQFTTRWPFEDHILDFENDQDLRDYSDLEYNLSLEDDALDDRSLDLEEIALGLQGGSWLANKNKNRNSIFLLSKQISEVLYGNNVFKLRLNGEGEYHLKENFTKANRERMRYLLLIAQPMGVSYSSGKTPDDALWCSILPQLEKLRIVAEQPRQARGYYDAPTPGQDTDCWINLIQPFLQCFGQHLSRQTVVQVDDDGQVETKALFKESLPNGYREIRCRLAGDLIFKRGQFSWESGYWDDGPRSSYDAYSDFGSD